MAYDVSSWFLDQLAAHNSEPVRQLTIAGSDYSERVLKWPRFKRTWNMIRPTDLAIDLANEDQAMNFFVNTPTTMRAECEIKLGFTHPTSGDELILLYSGTAERAQFIQGRCTLRLLDKMKAFTERAVGASDDPAVFSASNLLPSDIAWTLCTCYGGLSSIQSDSNPDIDWGTFQTWAAVFSADTVLMSAQFEGAKVSEALKRVSEMTESAIYNEHGQIEFKRFSTIDSLGTFLGDDELKLLSLEVDDTLIVNKQHVYSRYSVTSNYWQDDISAVDSTSVNSYGLREDIIKDNSVWYVDSASAQNMAQRRIANLGLPAKKFVAQSPLMPVIRSIGETIRLQDDFLGVNSSSGWRLMSTELDMESGSVKLNVDATQLLNPFILDDAYYGLLDQNYNFLL